MMSPDTATADSRVVDMSESGSRDHQGRLRHQIENLTRAASRRVSALRGIRGIGVWFGLVLILAGGGVLVFGWSQVADIGVVALQMPYLISAGGTGLALIAIGLVVVSISAKATDAADRRRQLTELQQTLAAIRVALEDRE